MNLTRKVYVVGGIACLAAVMAISIPIAYRFFNPYLDREIMGAGTISPSWLEITPKEPLKAERQINNLILMFDASQPYEPDDRTSGLRLPDGSVIIPEVQLIDQNGNTYALTSIGVSRNGMVLRNESLPQDRVYRTIRIRSDKPIKVSKIYWHCYNQWDVS